MRRKQFLFTKKDGEYPYLNKITQIGEYFLYLGIESEYCCVIGEEKEFHLIGALYDWENSSYSNQKILELIAQHENILDIIKESDRCFGQFILVIKLKDKIYLFNDATSQKEVYYDSEFTSYGTQVNLLELTTDLDEDMDELDTTYYNSDIFRKKSFFVGNTTHKRKAFHLLPNHYLDFEKKSSKRFFPLVNKKQKSVEVVAPQVAKMLKGYIKAVAEREKINLAVTAGFDSRLLFLASLDVSCEYFIVKHSYMKESHYDIAVGHKLTNYYNKQLNVVMEKKCAKEDLKNQMNDVDFPRNISTQLTKNGIIINGNISEIARNYYGYSKNVTAEDLSFLTGNNQEEYPIQEFKKWLGNKNIFEKNGYNYLDMFYWEEKMGNWCAKMKTETNALGSNVLSPFNSRGLLTLLLSTNRKYRDSHYNKLYNAIIYELSRRDDNILKIPINPTKKQKIIKLMKIFRIYNLYRYVGVKFRLLKI